MFPLIKLFGEVMTLAVFFAVRPVDRRQQSSQTSRR